MKKIPTLFERDWNGDRSRVTPQIHNGCEWVISGEGVATRKLDGTSCLIREGELYRRRELRKGDIPPEGFEQADFDEETGKTVGWVPVGDDSSDQYHREGFNNLVSIVDGTYELVGPKIQGNPERYPQHILILHDSCERMDAPRTFDGLKEWLADKDIEGVVFHHPDGRMAKIKLRDFGYKRKQSQ